MISWKNVVLWIALASAGFGSGMWVGRNQGLGVGIRSYHNQCFEIGGFIVDNENGTVVQCSPIGRVPKEELNNFKPPLDKSVKV